MKIKTSELTGAALDWAVAKCEGMDIEIRPAGACGRPLYVLAAESSRTPWIWNPSTSWHQGGPIIEREKIGIVTSDDDANIWVGSMFEPDWEFSRTGNTPLIAAMRGYVAGKMGDEIEIPEELK
jgi:hypothetical protein